MSKQHVYSFQNKVQLDSQEYKCKNVFANYHKVRQIGQGTYGEVWLATSKTTNELCAIKKIKIDGAKEKRQGFPVTAVREITVLQKLKHPHLVHMREVARSSVFITNGFKGSVYLAFEYAEHDLCGLHERIRRTHGNEMPASLTKRFMKQLLEAIAFCHDNNVLHRDLKSSNVLITKHGDVKLADFGLARFLPSEGDLTYRVCTLWYRPPELLLGATKYGGEVDIWSAGCVFFEMLTGRALFTGDKEASMLVSITQLMGLPAWKEHTKGSVKFKAAHELKHYKMLPKRVDTVSLEEHFKRSCLNKPIDLDALDLLKKMLSMEPFSRPSARECLQHPYFTDKSSVQPMTKEEFETLTDGFNCCHEYSIKQRERKRPRPEDMSTAVQTPEDGGPALKMERPV